MKSRLIALSLAAVMIFTAASPFFMLMQGNDVSAEGSPELIDFRLEVNQKVNVRDHLNDRSLEPEGAVYRIVESDVSQNQKGDATFTDEVSGWATPVCATDVQDPILLGTKTRKYIPGGVIGDSTKEGVVTLQMTIGSGSEMTVLTSCTVTICDPSNEVTDKFYFFIRIVDDYGIKNTTLDGFPEDELKEGFWVAGEGADASIALRDICDRNGWDLTYWEVYYKGWIDNFLGLGTYQQGGGDYLYWLQYYWDGGQWVFNDLCLGYLNTEKYKFIGLTFMTSTMEGEEAATQETSADVPKSLRFREDIDSGIWSTPASGMTLDRVPSDSYGRNKLGFESHSLTAGSKFQFAACVLPHTATNRAVTWSSSDGTVATIDSKGSMTALRPGTVTITATSSDGRFQDHCVVTITSAGTLGLDQISMSVNEWDSRKVSAAVTPDDETNHVKWFSSDMTVATVAPDGTVTGRSVGTATVYAYIGNSYSFPYSYKVTVTPAVELRQVSLGASEMTIGKDSSFNLDHNVTPANANGLKRTWSSSDEGVVTVDQSGCIRGVSEGTAKVTISVQQKNNTFIDECNVTVTGAGTAPEGGGDDGDGNPIIYAAGGAFALAVAAAAIFLIRRR